MVTNVLATLPTGSLTTTLVVDGAANVYTLNATTRTISKVGSDGTLTAAWATLPLPLATSKIVSTTDGTLYTANAGNSTISRVMPDGTVNLTYASLPGLSSPFGLVMADNGTLYTANAGTSSISAIDSSGAVTPFATLASGSKPFDVVVSKAGDLYTLNQNGTVSKVTASGTVTAVFATLAPAVTPVNVMVSSTGHVFALESGINQIEEFDATGTLVRAIALPGLAGRIAIDGHDNLFVTLRPTKSIGLVPPGGALVPSIATLTPGADYGPLAVTSTDTVYAVGLSNPIVSKISLAASITSAPVNGNAAAGGAFSATVKATGYEPLTFSLTGAVPPGVSIDRATGVISGPANTAGTYRFGVVATNMFGSSSAQEATLTVTAVTTPTPTAIPTPGSGSGSAAGGRGGSASGSLASTGAEVMLPGALALVLTAAGVAGLVTERRRRA
ncbi:Vgb family protein [Herbiconiux ginsengi]|uniref:Uncharacterized protein n=1 Tax=Herbiconiux ginsengi TaxID=381665 RepID=A0A1H3RR16_9MICO|nr:putative Ig domain-containing protein [Herbiconiux ginsengi]SDZ27698.1 hypothetical protein SAMN05216554_2984 [Herbiconiux ginsengi]